MRFEGDHLIPADPETVWSGLNDPEVLRRAIPGCESMEQTGEAEYTATVVARVGPVSARFRGKVEFSDLVPPVSYRISGRGQGGPAGFAKGGADIRLAHEGEGTRLSYVADVEVGGKLAAVGGRLIQGVARKNAEDFFNAFSRVVTGEVDTAVPASEGATQPGAMAAVAAGHIPLIDRVAWLLVGLGLGLGGCWLFG
ncbi:carbon monoxide dehydrogenase subunit G [Thioclava sp. 15-R06ZXC-3]|uniref:Carbon monoxide dehydrogenase subunit G n=1 Tax=Thioclava arctica TaxID=3238301 RepID=A0ABV3TFP8_9RHOB